MNNLSMAISDLNREKDIIRYELFHQWKTLSKKERDILRRLHGIAEMEVLFRIHQPTLFLAGHAKEEILMILAEKRLIEFEGSGSLVMKWRTHGEMVVPYILVGPGANDDETSDYPYANDDGTSDYDDGVRVSSRYYNDDGTSDYGPCSSSSNDGRIRASVSRSDDGYWDYYCTFKGSLASGLLATGIGIASAFLIPVVGKFIAPVIISLFGCIYFATAAYIAVSKVKAARAPPLTKDEITVFKQTLEAKYRTKILDYETDVRHIAYHVKGESTKDEIKIHIDLKRFYHLPALIQDSIIAHEKTHAKGHGAVLAYQSD